MKRLLLLALLLLAAILIPFVLWGDWISEHCSAAWLQSWGRWAWAIGIALLIADLLLPIPGTLVQSSLGLIYGFGLGGLIACLGSLLSGLIAYELCSRHGRALALRLCSEAELQRVQRWLERQGGALVMALSRSLPVLTEAVACIAGLVRMPRPRFLLALACGSLPTAFLYAGIGAMGRETPTLAMGASLLAPCLLWLLAQRLLPKTRAS